MKKPSGNRSSGGHASGRGASLERPRRRVRQASADADKGPKPPIVRSVELSVTVCEWPRNPRASWRPFALRPSGCRVVVKLQLDQVPTDPFARFPLAHWWRRLQRPRAVGYDRSVLRGRESNPRHPGYKPGALPLSYHDLIPPRFRIPARNAPRRPSGDGAVAPRA
jgi:hypothetical protein